MIIPITCPYCGGRTVFDDGGSGVGMHGRRDYFDASDGCGGIYCIRDNKAVKLDEVGKAYISRPEVKPIVEAALEQVRAAFWG